MRYGVAADVDDAARFEGRCRLDKSGRGPGARWVHDEHIDVEPLLSGFAHVFGRIARDEIAHAFQAVGLGISLRVTHALDISLNAYQANVRSVGACARRRGKADGAAAAVRVEHGVTLAQLHPIDGALVEHLGLLRIYLVKRYGGYLERAVEQLVVHAGLPMEQAGLATQDRVGHARVDVLRNRHDAGVLAGDCLGERVEVGNLARPRHEGEHRFVRAPPAAQHGVAQLSLPAVLVIRGDAEAARQARDLVEQLSCPRRLDWARGAGHDGVGASGKKAAAHFAMGAGGEWR